MPFGVVSGVGLGMSVLNFGGDRRRGRSSLGVNLRRRIVTNGDFVASLCGIAYNDRAVVWRGEWGGPGIHVLDGSPHASRGRGCYWRGFWHFSAFSIVLYFTMIDDRLVCEKLTIFPYAECIVEFCGGLAFL